MDQPNRIVHVTSFAPQTSAQMVEAQNNPHQTIVALAKEIDYKNFKYSELEFKYNDTTSCSRKLVTSLTDLIKSKDETLSELEHKCRQSSATIERFANENELLKSQCNKDVAKLRSIVRNLESVVERQRIELDEQAKELRENKVQSDTVVRALKDEIAKMTEKPQTQNPVVNCKDTDRLVNVLKKELKEKEEEILDLQTLSHILAARDFNSNKEMQECRKELINGLKELLTKRTKLVVKRMGEVDQAPFLELCFQRVPEKDWQGLAAEVCSCWQAQVQDSRWHPFKIQGSNSDGVAKEVVDETDEKLKVLRDEFGDPAYKAVTNALLELNEYNPSGRYTVAEIWNVKQSRKASLIEIIDYMVEQLKAQKRKRKRG